MSGDDAATGGRERCPNCGKVGYHHLSAEESEAAHGEWCCVNDNCRVAYYEVERPPRTDGGKCRSDHLHRGAYKGNLKKNPSTPKCGNTGWFVWRVEGFGIEESDERAAEAINAGEKVTIITTTDSGTSVLSTTDSDRDAGAPDDGAAADGGGVCE